MAERGREQLLCHILGPDLGTVGLLEPRTRVTWCIWSGPKAKKLDCSKATVAAITVIVSFRRRESFALLIASAFWLLQEDLGSLLILALYGPIATITNPG